MDELQTAWEQAWSIPAYMDTAGMIYIGKITRNNREYLFWRDLKGEYWYDSKPKGRSKPEWQQRTEHAAKKRHGRNH